MRHTAVDKLNDLTRREIDVLKLLAEGLFNKEIASRLNISERTVKNHVSNIFKKISVSDRTQAAVFAIKNNLIKITYLAFVYTVYIFYCIRKSNVSGETLLFLF